MQSPPSTTLRRTARSRGAFSLVEVVLAIGIIAFAFVAILGLIPAGLGQFRRAMDISVCTQIAQRIITDAQQTEFTTLIDSVNLPNPVPLGYSFQAPGATAAPTVNPPHYLRYFNDEGTEIVPVTLGQPTSAELAKVLYWVNTCIQPQSTVPSSTAGAAGSQSPSRATLVIDIANNPAGVAIPLTSGNRFTIPTSGTTITTYFAYIGAN